MFQLWRVVPWSRLVEASVLVLISLAVAAALRRLCGWRQAHTLATMWFAALLFFAGVAPIAATLAVLASAAAVGSWLVAPRSVADVLVALALGLALIAGCVGWLLPLPIHRPLVYLASALLVCGWRRRGVRRAAVVLWRGWREAVQSAPLHAAVAVSLLGLASTGAWLPTMHADDLAYHLGLPSQLHWNGFYALDPTSQIWALAPWLGDVVQGIAQVLAGRESRGAVDAMWLLLAAATLALLTKALRNDCKTAWLVVALFASLPLLATLVCSMQTELPATALLAALALVIVRAPQLRDRRLLVGAVLMGGLFALKFAQLIAAVVMLAWAAARWRARVDMRNVLAGLSLFALVAGSSYFYAWHVSGNPMLPLFNDVFLSPVMPPRQLVDPRWHAGFDAALAWSITFETPRYLEAEPGGYGFVLIALIGVWLLALWRHEMRGLVLAASAIALLPMLPMQYARYAFPGLALLLPALVVGGIEIAGERRFTYAVLALCALNLVFQANAPWPIPTIARKRLITHLGDTELVLRRFAPERVLIAELRQRDPSDSIVLALDARAASIAELAGRGRTVSWYSPSMEAKRLQADRDASGAGWRRLIDESHASWLLLRPDDLSGAQRCALAAAAARKIDAVGEAELWSWNASTSDRAAVP